MPRMFSTIDNEKIEVLSKKYSFFKSLRRNSTVSNMYSKIGKSQTRNNPFQRKLARHQKKSLQTMKRFVSTNQSIPFPQGGARNQKRPYRTTSKISR